MKLYFSAPPDLLNKDLVLRLKTTLRAKGITTIMQGGGLSPFTPAELVQNEAGEKGFLNKIQLVVIEGSSASSQVVYLIAFALAHRKPILVLLARGTPLDLHLRTLRRDKTVGRWLRVEFYQEKNILKLIEDFAEHWLEGLGRELPVIKFTLRLTPTVDRYLAWKGLQVKKTKANFLREIVEDMAKADQRFQVQLRKELEKY